jgi:hypothetical protein
MVFPIAGAYRKNIGTCNTGNTGPDRQFDVPKTSSNANHRRPQAQATGEVTGATGKVYRRHRRKHRLE